MSQSSFVGKRVGRKIGPELFRSVMIVVDVKTLLGFCFILDEFWLVLATSRERVHISPMGCVGVYEEAVKADLHFSLDLFVKRVIDGCRNRQF